MGQLWDLWSEWWSGRSVVNLHLWGWPILVWARLGKVLQFVAGLTIVLDLIGAQPLRAFGQRLFRIQWGRGTRGAAEMVAVVIFVVSLVAYVGFFVLSVASNFIPTLKGLFPDAPPAPEDEWNWLIVVGITAAWLVVASATHSFYYGDSTGKSKSKLKNELNNSLFVAPVVVAAAILTGIILLPWLLFIYVFCVPMSRGTAWLLDRTRPAHPLRWIAVALFVVGFHFDLLAS